MKSALFLFCLISVALCQSLPKVSLAAGNNVTALPIIPPDFKVTRQSGPTLNIPVGQAFHLLLVVIFTRWGDGSVSPAPAAIHIKDGTHNWAFDMRIFSRSVATWRNTNTVAWTAGRILENELATMTRDQNFWSVPKTSYSIRSPPDEEIGKAILRFERQQASSEQTSNSSLLAAQPLDNPDSTTNLTLPQEFRSMEISLDDNTGQPVSKKGVLFLFVEYMYRILFAMDSKRPVSEVVDEGGRLYLSDHLYGEQLKVFLACTEVAGQPIRMADIGRAFALTVAALSKRDTWKTFTAGVHWAGNPQIFVLFQIGPDLVEDETDSLVSARQLRT